MDESELLGLLNGCYPMRFDKVELLRDSGCEAYAAFAGGRRYFLRITKPMFFETATKSLDVHLYLQRNDFAVPKVLFTEEGRPYVRQDDAEGRRCCVLYEFVEGREAEPERDIEAIGALVGKLHRVMRSYPGALPERDKHYYIDRYIDIMRARQYERADQFASYGEALWDRVKDLPRGYCHGDMYCGNFLKTAEGRLYILDFDTSCDGFPMYDPALICNATDFFALTDDGYTRCKRMFERFLPEYARYSSLTQREIDAFPDLIAVYHFALQATIIELFGPDCVDSGFLDRQLSWLCRWREQCGGEGVGS